jgi:hypothetical protein
MIVRGLADSTVNGTANSFERARAASLESSIRNHLLLGNCIRSAIESTPSDAARLLGLSHHCMRQIRYCRCLWRWDETQLRYTVLTGS